MYKFLFPVNPEIRVIAYLVVAVGTYWSCIHSYVNNEPLSSQAPLAACIRVTLFDESYVSFWTSHVSVAVDGVIAAVSLVNIYSANPIYTGLSSVRVS